MIRCLVFKYCPRKLYFFILSAKQGSNQNNSLCPTQSTTGIFLVVYLLHEDSE